MKIDSYTKGNLKGYLRAAENGVNSMKDELLKETAETGPGVTDLFEQLDKASTALQRAKQIAGLGEDC